MGVRETTTTESLEQATTTEVEFSSILKSEVTGFSVYRLTPFPEITCSFFFLRLICFYLQIGLFTELCLWIGLRSVVYWPFEIKKMLISINRYVFYDWDEVWNRVILPPVRVSAHRYHDSRSRLQHPSQLLDQHRKACTGNDLEKCQARSSEHYWFIRLGVAEVKFYKGQRQYIWHVTVPT